MLYCVEPSIYPKQNQFIEEITYNDENDLEWKIARVENGFFVRYFGDKYFSYNIFCVTTKLGELIKIQNTNCIFFQNADFDTFCEMRNIIKIGWTDDIWEAISYLLTERFNHDLGMIESEIIS